MLQHCVGGLGLGRVDGHVQQVDLPNTVGARWQVAARCGRCRGIPVRGSDSRHAGDSGQRLRRLHGGRYVMVLNE